jgi:hypothetical protein
LVPGTTYRFTCSIQELKAEIDALMNDPNVLVCLNDPRLPSADAAGEHAVQDVWMKFAEYYHTDEYEWEVKLPDGLEDHTVVITPVRRTDCVYDAVRYEIGSYEASLSTFAAWSEDKREVYTGHDFLGEGRSGYYFNTHALFCEIGWCDDSLCVGYGKKGLEIFDFNLPMAAERIPLATLKVHTVTPDTESWYDEIEFDAFVNNARVGSGVSAARGGEKTAVIPIPELGVLRSGLNNIVLHFKGDPPLDGTLGRLTQVYWVELEYCYD